MKLNRRWLLAILPALVILPVLPAPLPLANSHGLREIAGYFQALAILRTGVDSYTFITPFESRSALHLHSLLSTPLLALGYREAGRLVSLLAAIGGAVLLSQLAATTYGRRAGLLAPLFLWIQPIYARFAARWWPESVSILLTVGAVYATYRFTETTERRYAAATFVLLAVAPTNHMWEASIALPVVALFLATKHYRHAVGASIVTGVAVAGTWIGTSFQPAGASSITHFGLHNDPTILLELSWWNGITRVPIHPTVVEETLILPVGLIVAGWTGYRAVTERDPREILLSTWLVSGLAVPLLLPLGANNHMYYVWGLVAPLALFAARETSRYIPRVSGSLNRVTVVRVVVSLLVVSAMGSALVFEAGVFEAMGGPEPLASSVDGDMHSQVGTFEYGELERTGHQLQASGITQPSEIAFVGAWGQNADSPWTARQRFRVFAAYRILIYSDMLVAGQNSERSIKPVFVEDASGEACAQWIAHNDTDVWTGSCS